MQSHTTAKPTTDASPPSKRDAARAYAELGRRVVPLHSVTVDGGCSCGHVERADRSCECGDPKCRVKHKTGSNGKHPRIYEWQKHATTDAATITSWWERWPDANVGLATGGDWFCLDVDPRNGGLESLAALEAEHGPLPETIEAATGGGGSHYLFEADPVHPIGCTKIGPGLDIKGIGGQIVVAPSVSASGAYRWVRPPGKTQAAPAPAWLLAKASKAGPRSPGAPAAAPQARGYFPPASTAVLDEARKALELHGPGPERVNGEGGGLHTVQACAILTHDFALTPAESWPLLLEWNTTRTPPWDLDELRERLSRGERYGKAPYGSRRTMDARARAEKLISDWQTSGDQDPIALIQVVRELTFDDTAVREYVLNLLRAATGLSAKAINLPRAINLAERQAQEERRRAFDDRTASDLIDVQAPLDTARRFLDAQRDADGYPMFVRWQGESWEACGTHYEPRTDEVINNNLYRFADSKRDVMTGAPVKPDRAFIEELAHALRAAAALEINTAPGWINGAANDAPAAELIAFQNGLLHVPTRTFQPPTRRFFTLNAVGFHYSPTAPRPVHWLGFLAQLWPGDLESIETLQEFMGLALTGDTSFQKLFMLVGPKRGGKGTIARMLKDLVGEANFTAPTLNGLGQHFGQESLIGKTLAVISDARLSGRTDLGAVTETLLRISGEDTISVPRKHRGDYTAKLQVRFLILSNEVPALLDQSGALASRFIVLRLTRSFLGQEDRGLTTRLQAELPGVLHWALEGLDRLRTRGYFRQPASAMEAVQQLETLGSPVKAFVAERCELKPGASVECGALYYAWMDWSRAQGREHPGTAQIFGRNLSAAYPEVNVSRPRVGGVQVRHYDGIKLSH